MFDRFLDLFAEDEVRPNKFTLFVGEKVRTAREEAGWSQEKLAKHSYLRRATLSDIENGKSEPNISTYLLIAYNLNKPIAYFLPEYMYRELKQEELSPAENEIITNLRYYIASDHFVKLVVDIIKAIGKLDVDSFVVEQAPITAAKLENEDRKAELRRQKKKK